MPQLLHVLRRTNVSFVAIANPIVITLVRSHTYPLPQALQTSLRRLAAIIRNIFGMYAQKRT